jgi:regulator of cell morphogenesis and NO signaling
LDFQLPRIRQQLAATLDMDSDVQIATLILQFYDEYVREIRTHIEHEKEHSYEQHPRDDEHVAQKARELKGLIIKYYPGNEARGEEGRGGRMQMLYAVLHDLHHFEQELALHCAIEDNIMLPALHKQLQEESSKNLDNAAGGEVEELSAREVEIVKHIAQGLSNKEIADVLCISTHTVMSHRKNIARKLDIHSTAGLTIYAVVNGIVAL